MKGRKIFRNKKTIVFVQVDKNNQVTDLYEFNSKNPYEKRIGARCERQILSDFRGRPLVLCWNELIEALELPLNEEETEV